MRPRLPRPGKVLGHENMGEVIDEAAEGYRNFDDRKDGWTKVILHP
jgi:glutathione-independent formaldehyde dehydrogenase